MRSYKYLIIGGGMTASAAIDGIREVDSSGEIGLISAEPDAPYNRPPLSKALWKGTPIKTIARKMEHRGVELHLGRHVQRLDREKRITDERGEVLGYERLLLATGGRPRRLSVGDDQVIYFRTLADYHKLRRLAESGRRFAVIGGGFIGSEIAAALAINGRQVVMICRGAGIGDRIFPADLSDALCRYYREKGVEVLTRETVMGLEPRGDRRLLRTSAGREILVDGVVTGIGLEPNVELAREAGLVVENGIRVDEFLRTSERDIYAAGDVACFHDPTLDRWGRVEHEDNALTMGHAAGASMAGGGDSYKHLSFFYSDLFDLGYEAVGELDPRLTTVADWKEPFREGVVYHLRNGRVRGVLLWNVWGQVDAARSLIASQGPYQAADLKGRLPA